MTKYLLAVISCVVLIGLPSCGGSFSLDDLTRIGIETEPLYYWTGYVYEENPAYEAASGESAGQESTGGGASSLGSRSASLFDQYADIRAKYDPDDDKGRLVADAAVEIIYELPDATSGNTIGGNNAVRKSYTGITNEKGEFRIGFRWNKHAQYTIRVADVTVPHTMGTMEYGAIAEAGKSGTVLVVDKRALKPLIEWTGVVKGNDANGPVIGDAIVRITIKQGEETIDEPYSNVDPETGGYSILVHWQEDYQYSIAVRIGETGGIAEARDRGSIGEVDARDDFFLDLPLTFNWTGKVLDTYKPTEPGRAVPNAVVKVTATRPAEPDETLADGPESEEFSGVTNDNGDFAVEVKWYKGYTYDIQASKTISYTPPGQASRHLVITGTPVHRSVLPYPGVTGLSDTLQIVIPEYYTLTGAVGFDDGNGAVGTGITGAQVKLIGGPEAEQQTIDVVATIDGGLYSIGFPWHENWHYTLVATLPDQAAPYEERELGRIAAGDMVQDFVVDNPIFNWTGTVADESETGIPDASVTLTARDMDGGFVFERSGVTDTDGNYLIAGFEWNADYLYTLTVVLEGESVPAAVSEKGRITHEDQVDDFLVSTTAVLNWSGTVSYNDTGNTPVDGGMVVLTAMAGTEEEYSLSTLTSDTGGFSINFVWSAEYEFTISIYKPGEASPSSEVTIGMVPRLDRVNDFKIEM